MMVAASMVDAVEKPVPLCKAGRLFDSNPSLQTLIRWKSSGVLARDKKTRVVLRSKVIGGRCFIDPSAAREFVAALNAEPVPAHTFSGTASEELESLDC